MGLREFLNCSVKLSSLQLMRCSIKGRTPVRPGADQRFKEIVGHLLNIWFSHFSPNELGRPA
jgi:hypothetical protein